MSLPSITICHDLIKKEKEIINFNLIEIQLKYY